MTPPTDPSYTAQALRTESPITPALQTRLKDNARLVHAVLGLQTEAGELADPVKKHIYYGRPLDLVNLREEIGDCLWYLAIAADALGTTLEAEQARNLAKLRARYPHVFTAEAAQVRDLDREREVLEEDVADDPHTLRQQLAAARAESVAMRKQLDEALKLIADVNTAGLQLWDKLQIANKAAAELIVERHAARAEIESLRKELDAAQAEITTLQGASAADDQRLRDAEERIWPGMTWGCDAPDKMADEILHLRQQLAEQQAETVDVRRQRNNETDRLNATNAVSVQQRDEIAYLRTRLDEERSVSADLRQQLADAQRAVSDAFAEVNSVREQLDAARAAVTLQRSGVERLQAFVGQVREARDEHNGLDRDARLEAALAELDAGTEPTPVAEPTPCPECERLRVELETANEIRSGYAKEVSNG